MPPALVTIHTFPQTGYSVAVKSIPKSELFQAETVKAEIDVLRALNHPNCMETLGVFEDRKNVHVVSPLYAGGELFDAISSRGQHTFSERDAAAIVRQILEAVDHCHQQDVTHRDLKPENIMFKNDGSHYDLSSEQHADSAQNTASEMGDGFDDLVIVDFGMARYHRHSEPPMRSQVGSPSYVAPEVVRGLGYTRSCDIWSVGVIMYILLCGEPPFHGSNQSQTMRRVSHSIVC